MNERFDEDGFNNYASNEYEHLKNVIRNLGDRLDAMGAVCTGTLASIDMDEIERRRKLIKVEIDDMTRIYKLNIPLSALKDEAKREIQVKKADIFNAMINEIEMAYTYVGGERKDYRYRPHFSEELYNTVLTTINNIANKYQPVGVNPAVSEDHFRALMLENENLRQALRAHTERH